MQQRLPLWLMLLVLGFCVSLRAQTPAATGPVISAQIIATKVIGKVSMKLADQASDVKNNMTVPTHAVVATGDNASVVLVFSNGATTQLGKNSELSIDEFLQDPFSASINPADPSRDSEPSISQTKLRLTHGELVGDVKHLNHAQGSTFVVETPVGAAGIRGTVFRIVFIPDPVNPGRYTFSLSVPQGAVNLTQNTPGAVTTQTTTTTTGTSSSSTTAGGTTTQTDTTTTTGTTTQTGGTTPTQSITSSTATSSGLTTGVNVAQGNEIVVLVDIKTTTTANGQTVITATTSAPITANNPTPINATTTATLMQTATTITTVATTVTNNFQTTTATGAITTSVTGNPNAAAPSNPPPSTTTTTTTTTTSNNPNQNQNNPNQTPTQEKTTTSTITQTQAPTQNAPSSTTTINLGLTNGAGGLKPPGG